MSEASPEKMVELEPGVRLSGHMLSQEIGRGGYSRVFRAVPEGGGEAVAIKIAVRPELVAALRSEGAVLRKLQGPRFVAIKEEHLDADPPYFVLELCKGGDLRALLEKSRNRRLPPEEALRIFEGVLEGVAFAHEEGVVHGDLKPENILLDAEGEPKIADLGLSRAHRRQLLREESKVAASAETEVAKVRGTFDYLAPEVRRTGDIAPASDVYALGVILYEMLVGARPLGHFELPGEVLGGGGSAPTVMDRVVARALAHEAHERYPDAGAMLADLRAGNQPAVVAPGNPVRERGPNPLLLSTQEETWLDQAIFVAFFPAVLGLLGLLSVSALWIFRPGMTIGNALAGWVTVLAGAAVTISLGFLVLGARHRLERRSFLERVARATGERAR